MACWHGGIIISKAVGGDGPVIPTGWSDMCRELAESRDANGGGASVPLLSLGTAD